MPGLTFALSDAWVPTPVDLGLPEDASANLVQSNRASAELSYWRERDYILHRDGTATALRVEQVGEALEFVDRDRALSDHPALYARFRITTRTGVERGDP